MTGPAIRKADVLPKEESYGPANMLRDWVILLSVVNVAYIRVWTSLLTLQRPDRFWIAQGFRRKDYLAAITGVLLLSGLLLGITVWTRRRLGRWGHRVGLTAFLALALVPLLQVRNVLNSFYPNEMAYVMAHSYTILKLWYARLVVAAAALVAVVLIYRYRRMLPRIVSAVFLTLSPFVLVTFGESLWVMSAHRPIGVPLNKRAEYLPNARTTPRVLWVIWDEWDYRLTFVDRNPTLALPAIDRLRGESFFAENAVPPGTQTLLSLPSLIDGKRVAEMKPTDWAGSRLRYAGSRESIQWGTEANVFSKARAASVNTALVGWYLPYCRVIGADLTSCSWMPEETPANSTGETIPEKVVNQARSVLETNLLSPFGQSLSTRKRIRTYFTLVDRLKTAASNRRLGLTLAHIPVPHSPNAYDRDTATFTLGNRPYSGYIDSLALLDRTIADLREHLERSGDWNQLTIIFSTDHPFRSARHIDGKMDSRIPFIARFPGSEHALAYKPLFNTVGTADIVLAVLRGEIASPEQLAAWLDVHRDTTVVQVDPAAASKQ